MRYLAIISLLSLLSCAAKIESEGSQEDPIPENSSANIVLFKNASGDAVKVSEVIVMSDNLEKSKVRLKPTTPTAWIEMPMEVKQNSFATYSFHVLSIDGTPYYATANLYLPDYGGLKKTISLEKSWRTTKLKDGLNWHNYEGYELITDSKQVINVLELDLDSEDLKLEFVYYPDRAKISEVAQSNSKFVAITNASFGSGFTSGSPVDNTYIRVEGVTHREIGLSPDDSNYGKHESAVWYDGVSEIGFIDMPGDFEAALEYYKKTTYPNLFSSVPMLISDYNKVNFKSYKRKLSSSPGPLTALAVTCDRKLLLITIDGRWTDKAAGMTYSQLQDFLRIHFNPKYAINMDGGGSTCMYIKGKNVVNYPCEGGAGSGSYMEYPGTFKERGLVTFFAIREK